MHPLQQQLAALPTIDVGGQPYLSHKVVTTSVAAFLFPHLTDKEIDEAAYRQILETADFTCRELGYTKLVKLAPPQVLLHEAGLYWTAVSEPPPLIHAGPTINEMLKDGRLVDARLTALGVEEVSRQHFKIPVTASAAVVELMTQAVASEWPNDYKSIWHDLLTMCVKAGTDKPDGRHFSVLIRGLRRGLIWRFIASVKRSTSGTPYLAIRLADELSHIFELGQVVMTIGAQQLGVDFSPFLAQHSAGIWGELGESDKRANDRALKQGERLFSMYKVPLGDNRYQRIYIITEWNRSATTIMLPSEY